MVEDIDAYVSRFPRAGGFIYVLTNEAHPRLQKIGFTTRSPAERASELDRTGTAYPFKVALALYQAEPRAAEQRLHLVLARQRVRNEREFFAMSLEDTVAVIVEEFGDDSNYFDPDCLTPAARTRDQDERRRRTAEQAAIWQRKQVAAMHEQARTASPERVRRKLLEIVARQHLELVRELEAVEQALRGRGWLARLFVRGREQSRLTSLRRSVDERRERLDALRKECGEVKPSAEKPN